MKLSITIVITIVAMAVFGESAVLSSTETNVAETEEVEILNFVDVYGEEYQVEVENEVAKHPYDLSAFVRDGDKLSYQSTDDYDFRLGVDVSHHQGKIDWNLVKSDGYDFAIIRLGYRGYGQEGNLHIDRRFSENIVAAQAAGLDVGVYFFSQAISSEEAQEEANLVIDTLQEYEIQLPVVYDPEHILDDDARTDEVSGEQFTQNAKEFCKCIKTAGYEPMIYSNMLWEAYELDLVELSEYPIWYADYELLPQTPYAFEIWQYSNVGNVNGIAGNTDLDIQLIRKNPLSCG